MTVVAFEVASVFKIINQASPTLTKILAQVRQLNAAIDKAKLSIADLGTIPTTGIKAAVGEVDALAASWRSVAAAAVQAKTATASATIASARAGALAATGGAGGGRGGRAATAGGSSSFQWQRPHGGTAAAIGLGGLAYGVDLSMTEQDAIYRSEYAAGLQHNPENDKRFADIIENAVRKTGFSVRDVSGAVLQATRMLQGVPGNGLDIVPDLLLSAANEARNKEGTSLGEAVTAQVGLAHMTTTYDPAKIKGLMSQFGFLSTVLPMSLQQMERAASYSVPVLQSGLGIDPQQSMLLGAVLARAGVTSSKSGTWLRDLFERAMPGTTNISKTAFSAHEGALRQLGLVGADGKPTWLTDGKPDALKFIEMASKAIQNVPLTQRAAVEKAAFGQRGAGAAALLANPAVLDQAKQLLAIENSQSFKNRFANFGEAYNQDSPLQKARVAVQGLNLNLMKLGTDVLPGVNLALGQFVGVMDKLRSVIPGASKDPKAAATIGADAIWGAGVGAAAGSFMPGLGTVAGGVVGGLTGGAYGVAESYMKSGAMANMANGVVSAGKSFENSVTDSAEKFGTTAGSAIMRFFDSYMKTLPAASGSTKPIHLSLNIDSRTLAETMSTAIADVALYTTGGPTGNNSARWSGGDDYSPDI